MEKVLNAWSVQVTSFEQAKKVQSLTRLHTDMQLFEAVNYYGKQGFVLYKDEYGYGEFCSLEYAKEQGLEITPFEEFLTLF